MNRGPQSQPVTLESLKAGLDHFVEFTRSEFNNGRERFRGLEEKIDCVRDDMTSVTTKLAVVEDKVHRVHRAVHEDNGQPSLTTRLAVLEALKTAAAVEPTIQAARITGKWYFWTGVIGGLVLLISTLITALAALAKG